MEQNNIYAKLNVVRTELSKSLKKGGRNNYSNYNYFQLEDFMPQAIQLCNENGLFTQFWIDKEKVEMPSTKTTQNAINDEGVVTGTVLTEQDNFVYVEYAHVLVIDVENPENQIEFKKETRECSVQAAQPIQNLGSKSTYMKRYMYFDVFEINQNDSIEENTGKPEKVETKPTRKSSSKPKVTEVSTKPVQVAPVEPIVQVAPTPVAPVQTAEPTAREMLNNLEAQTPVTPVETTISTDELMSMQTKMDIAQAITKAGFNARDMIVELAREIGTDVPLLKESDKDKILNLLESKKGE